MIKRKVIILLFVILHINVFSQNNFTQNESQFIQQVNPSYLGYNSLNTVGILFNTQTVSNESTQSYRYFFGGYSIENRDASVALDVNSFDLENNGFTSTNAKLSFIYKIRAGISLYVLPAVSVGYVSNSITFSSLIFEDQINAITGFILSESLDPLSQNLSTANFFNLNASVLVHNEKFIAGLSLSNLNQPNSSFNEEAEIPVPISISLQYGREFELNPYGRRFLPEKSYLFVYSSLTSYGGTMSLFLSQELILDSFSVGLNQRAVSLDSFSLTNIGFSLGASIENFDFGMQYSAPIRSVNQTFTASSFELYLKFNFSIYRRNRKGNVKRLTVDNY